MNKPLLFDPDWLENFGEVREFKRPAESALFVAYLKQFAPQIMRSDKPIHKTNSGYATNTSPWSDMGRFEMDLKEKVLIYRHRVPKPVGGGYEYEIVVERRAFEFLPDRMMVH